MLVVCPRCTGTRTRDHGRARLYAYKKCLACGHAFKVGIIGYRVLVDGKETVSLTVPSLG